VNNSFHKKERLSSRKQMDFLFAKGRSKTASPLKLIYINDPEKTEGKIQVMFVVPKRKFKKAHDRNTLKRRIREAYRVSKAEFYTTMGSENKLNIAFLYIGNKEESYQTINFSVKALLLFLTQEITQKSPK
jgi:ribonuclease P protein component